MSDLADHLVVAAVAFAVVLGATPVVRFMARRVGAVAAPGERHIHLMATPTLGGLAIFAGVLAALAAATRLRAFDELFRTTNQPEAIVLGSLVIVTVGVLDDTRGLTAPAKLAGQILAAGTMVLFGITLRFVYLPGNPGSIVSLSPDLAALFTIVAIVAMVNAVNLVDGLDGLAAGIVAIAAGSLFIYTQIGRDPGAVPVGFEVSGASLLLAAIVGACLGFLAFNFHPASIFMGDTGALLLGLLLAASGVSAIGNTIQPTRTDFAVVSVPVLIPFLVLAVPFIDTLLAIFRRLASGRSISSPDKSHLHHRLLQIGHSQRRAVLIMYYWSALLSFAVVGGALLASPVVWLVVGGGIGLGVVVWVAGRIRRRTPRGRHRAKRVDAGQGIVYSFTSAWERREKRRSEQH